MRALFLDIDGVLQSRRSIVAYGGGGNPLRPYPMDEVAFQLLRRTVEKTGAKIVLSSSWRGGGLARAATWFVCYGWYDAPIIGEIGHVPYDKMRGAGVQTWLEGKELESYVILDDSTDFFPSQPHVHVDGREGYSYSDHVEATSILNSC